MLAAVTVTLPSVPAPWSPGVGHLVIQNDMTLEDGECIGAFSAAYGARSIERPILIEMEPTEDCDIDVWWKVDSNTANYASTAVGEWVVEVNRTICGEVCMEFIGAAGFTYALGFFTVDGEVASPALWEDDTIGDDHLIVQEDNDWCSGGQDGWCSWSWIASTLNPHLFLEQGLYFSTLNVPQCWSERHATPYTDGLTSPGWSCTYRAESLNDPWGYTTTYLGETDGSETDFPVPDL